MTIGVVALTSCAADSVVAPLFVPADLRPRQDVVIGTKRVLATGVLVRGSTSYPDAVITYDQDMDNSDVGSNPGIELWQDISLSHRLERSNDNNGQWDYVIAGAYFASGDAVVWGTRFGSNAPQERTWTSSGSSFLTQTSGWPAEGWESLTDMTTTRQWAASAFVSGKFYVFGGFADYSQLDQATTEVYNPVTNKWTAGATMPAPRYATNGAQVIGTKVYVAGGFAYPAVPQNSLFILNTSTNTWTSGAPVPAGGGCGGSGVLTAASARVVVLVGCTSSSSLDSLLFSYDPTLNRWDTLAVAPQLHVYPATAVYGNKLYVFGGFSDASNTVSAAVHAFDLATNAWTSAPAMITARFGATAQVANGKIYVIGGRSDVTTSVSTTEIFDPVAGTWTTGPSMSTPRADPTSGVYNNRIHVVGGSNGGLGYYRSLELLAR